MGGHAWAGKRSNTSLLKGGVLHQSQLAREHRVRIFCSYPLPCKDQRYGHAVSNSWEHFPDHSVLSATLAFPKADPLKACWPKPQPIQHTDKEERSAIQNVELETLDVETSSDAVYTQICVAFENGVHQTKRKLGHPGLTHAQPGRGKTKQRSFQKSQVTPLKASRHGELTPSFDGLNLRYKRWFTQLRRLTAYRNLVNLNRQEASALEHKYKLWKSIMLAPSFDKSFGWWWPHRATKPPQETLALPSFPPSIEVAQYCLTQFQLELEQFEKVRRQEQQVSRYQADANQIFRDVRKQRPEPVQVLLAKETAVVVVTQVLTSTTISLRNAGECMEAKTWQSKQGVRIVQSQQASEVTFESEHGLVVGDVLSHEQLVGSVSEIHDVLASEWSARWDKHMNLPDDHWQEITKSAELALPSIPMQYTDLGTWKQTIAAKKTRTATGPDGIFKQDLLAMPDALRLEIIILLHRAERADW